MAELAETLSRLAPGAAPKKVFLTNSGTEAIEAAIKLARFATRRKHVIAFYGAFHGRTMGALSLTASRASHRAQFSPLVPDVHHVPYGFCLRCPHHLDHGTCSIDCIQYIERVLFRHEVGPEEVAAIFVEPIQGEGGYIVPPAQFLQRLRELTTQHGMLLIADEVQSGMGRTGKMFALDHVGLKTDVVTVAKGIASGLPLGVTCARADVMTWPPGAHASTFGGNPVACAAAAATIKLLKDHLIANAATVGEYLMYGIRELQDRHAIIGDVRGKGMMIGIELVRSRVTKERAIDERNALVQAMFRRGVLVLGAGKNALRLAPPLVLTRAQADSVLRVLDEALSEVSR
jgi:4-aminobutyrate aminotransferase